MRAIVSDGHSLANHTWDHPNLYQTSTECVKSELKDTDELIKRITGKSMAPNWRPPYGNIDARIRKAAESVGFSSAWLWDVDSQDWLHRGATQRIIKRVKLDLRNCNQPTCHMLFHDLPTSVKALRIIIPMLKNEGHQFVNFTF